MVEEAVLVLLTDTEGGTSPPPVPGFVPWCLGESVMLLLLDTTLPFGKDTEGTVEFVLVLSLFAEFGGRFWFCLEAGDVLLAFDVGFGDGFGDGFGEVPFLLAFDWGAPNDDDVDEDDWPAFWLAGGCTVIWLAGLCWGVWLVGGLEENDVVSLLSATKAGAGVSIGGRDGEAGPKGEK